MSSPADRGPQTSGRDLRREHDDASVTANIPTISEPGRYGGGPAGSSSGGSGGSSSNGGPGRGSNGGAPVASPRPNEDWSVPPSAGPHAQTSAVPTVAGGAGGGVGGAPVPGGPAARAAAGFPASATTTLPPRPGETAAGGTAAARPAARRPLRGGAPAPARRAQLTLRRFNVWSVFKFSCMLAIALWLVWMIAIGVLYGILDGSGVVGSINTAWSTLQGDATDDIIRSSQVLGIAAIVGVVYIVLFIALSTIFAVIYNLVSDFVGGVEVTLSERE